MTALPSTNIVRTLSPLLHVNHTTPQNRIFFRSSPSYLARRALFLGFVALLIGPLPSRSPAAIAFWTGASTLSANWSDSSNWFPAVPTNGDNVVYGLDSNTTNFDDIAGLTIDSLTFSATVVPFTVHIDAGISLSISGTGVINNSSNTQSLINDPSAGGMLGGHTVFQNSSMAGTIAISNNGGNGIASSPGITFFQDSSSAGAATITNNQGTSAGQNGETIFQGSATGGMATLNNHGITVFLDSASGGNATINNSMGGTDFRNSSTAGNATITNAGQTISFSPVSPGRTDFLDTASAAGATIINNGGTASSTIGGTTRFNGSSTAASAIITNNASSVNSGGSGETDFKDTSTAGNATINNGGSGIADTAGFERGGLTFFLDSSSAGNATINNNGGTNFSAAGGQTAFFGGTADNAIIVNNGGVGPDARGGATQFFFTSTAGNATLIANAGSPGRFIPPGIFIPGGLGGTIQFNGASTGGTARVEVFGDGSLDISHHNSPGVTVGSIEGNGSVFLGANNLTVGSNNLTTTYSGSAQDGGDNGGTGGSLTKIGNGTLTLSGTNTYTGATAVNSGKLVVDGSTAASSGVTVNAGAVLGGHGVVSSISGAGTIAPGNSPGILTASSLNPSGGTNLNFEFTQTGSPTYGNAANSGNDLIHLTAGSPFFSALTSTNQITIDFTGAALAAGQLYRGGFFTDTATDTSFVSNAAFVYLGLNGFDVHFDGFVTENSANFASGVVLNGSVLQFDIEGTGSTVPDTASSLLLLSLALVPLLGLQRRRVS
jgi:autotransporter-associated beta strand protein